MRVAAIDLGSNSTRLLVADVCCGRVIPYITDLKTTRLGQGMGEGRLREAAMERTIRVVQDFMGQAHRVGAANIILAATSAVRDAANRAEFAAALAGATGRELVILSGTEEARLVYLGVASSLGPAHGSGWPDSPGQARERAVVVDVGGGSTEFIWSGADQTYYASVRAGALRMTEGGYGQGQVLGVLGGALGAVRRDSPGPVIGVGGTITTLAAMAQGLRDYDPQKVHGFVLLREQVDWLYRRVGSLSPGERAKLPGLQPQRADIIPAGIWIVGRILQGLERDELIVSEADLLYGLALEAAGINKLE